MLLKKYPETESEYWSAIEALGGLIYDTRRDIAKDRIPNGDSAKNLIGETATLQLQLLKEIEEKFGVIPPGEGTNRYDDLTKYPAPEGKIHYWEWYPKMKLEFFTQEHEKLVCSVCPFSGGAKAMVFMPQIPCNAINGSIYRIRNAGDCGAVNCKHWTEKQLYSEITKKGGKPVRDAFIKKQNELKEKKIVSVFA